eukprot:5331755-Prymnesium_polylepis.1
MFWIILTWPTARCCDEDGRFYCCQDRSQMIKEAVADFKMDTQDSVTPCLDGLALFKIDALSAS